MITDFTHEVTLAEDRCHRLLDTLRTLELVDIYRFPERGEELTTTAALQAEMLTCHLRNILFDAAGASPSGYYASAAKLHGTEVRSGNGIFTVTLPRLMPKKRCRDSDEFLLAPVRYLLDAFFKARDDPPLGTCTVCVEHIYSRDAPGAPVRDYDNLQLKKLLDLVTLYAMVDDSGKYCDLFQTTAWADKPCTRISVMTRERFPRWLKDQ